VNPLEYILYFFIAVAAIRVFYFLFFFVRLSFVKQAAHSQKEIPVSVIICARNEAKNLTSFLPEVFSQQYPTFEVIVVNDCSWDGTKEVLEEFETKHPNMKIVTLEETNIFKGGKKFALTLGIKAAQYDTVVLTDADCRPASANWLSGMVAGFQEGKSIVLGYGAYEKRTSLLNMLIRLDTFYIAMQYLSFAKAGIPYMGVGRNLAYRKELFFNNKGFASHSHLTSGDDDLFINEVANGANTGICMDSNSHTISIPETTLGAWIKQKKRHLTTSSRYKPTQKILLGLWSLSYYFFIASFAVLASLEYNLQIVLSIFIAHLLIQISIFIKPSKQLRSADLMYALPITEMVLMLIYPIFAVANLLAKRKQNG
jgi:glycosyltransferase involved in cell wall biosynthesis